ncbi:MAG: hypothetical protein U0L98_04670 [Clostridia bacterium]|nr:hypothetical protein [Clostridia bacterium]
MILIILAIVCLVILVVLKVNDKNKENISKKLNIWLNILFISVIGLVVCVALGRFIETTKAIYTVVMYVIGAIGAVALIGCTVIGIKDKEKLPIWVSLIQAIVIVAIVGNIINGMMHNNRQKEEEKYIKEYTQEILDNK